MSSSCTICTDELDGPCSVTACGHLFHTKCLLTWFDHQPVCPLCKTKPAARLSDFVRELKAPERVDMSHGDVVAIAAAQGPPSPQAEAKVRVAISHASQEENAALAAKAEVEGRTKLKRARINGLQAELLDLKRQLKSTQHKEQRQEVRRLRLSPRLSPTLPLPLQFALLLPTQPAAHVPRR